MTNPSIKHIIVLMLENRSFDHMLGFSKLSGTDARTGRPTVVDGLTGTEQNTFDGTPYQVQDNAAQTMSSDPGHDFPDVVTQLCGTGVTYPPGGPYPSITSSGFVANYASSHGGSGTPGDIMRCYSADHLPVLNALAAEFAVCDAWHASMPGPTWPNRFFAMAASAGGLDCSPSLLEMIEWELYGGGFEFEHGTIFDALGNNGRSWRLYRGDEGPIEGSLPIASALKNISWAEMHDYSQFAQDLQNNDIADFTWIEPNYGEVATTYRGGTSQHPMDTVAAGETLIKQTYEALRNSPAWNDSLLIVTWDEHGGFYDHVAPAAVVSPGDKAIEDVNKYGFVFDRLGVRVPAVIVSPLVPKNLIDHTGYEHSSIPATTERLFGLSPLTNRDKHANDVLHLASLSTPRTDTLVRLPDPASFGSPVPAAVTDPALAPDAPIGQSNLAGFVGAALHHRLDAAPADERPAILDQAAQVRTRAQARDYIASTVAALTGSASAT